MNKPHVVTVSVFLGEQLSGEEIVPSETTRATMTLILKRQIA